MLKYTEHQKKILRDLATRPPTIFQKASVGDKSARHFTEILLGAGDYSEGDMDGPKNYQHE